MITTLHFLVKEIISACYAMKFINMNVH